MSLDDVFSRRDLLKGAAGLTGVAGLAALGCSGSGSFIEVMEEEFPGRREMVFAAKDDGEAFGIIYFQGRVDYNRSQLNQRISQPMEREDFGRAYQRIESAADVRVRYSVNGSDLELEELFVDEGRNAYRIYFKQGRRWNVGSTRPITLNADELERYREYALEQTSEMDRVLTRELRKYNPN